MGEQYTELSALLRKIRARWRAMTALRAWTWAAAAAAVVLLLALVAHRVAQPEGRVLVALWAVAGLAAAASLAWIVGPLRRAPGDGQVARFVEECCPELEDTLVTAVAEGGRAGTRPLLAAVVGDALHRVRALDPDRVVSRDALRRAAITAAAATVAFFVMGVFSAGPAGRAARVFALYVFPERLVLEVVPGDMKVQAGQPLQIRARIPGTTGGVVPILRYGADKQWREARMEPDKDGHAFGFAFEHVEQGFTYTISAASATSREYNVTVIRPPRVERIDLHYEYPEAFGLKPRIEEDSGDIYGPAGTRVRVSVQADKPVTRAMLNLVGGTPVALSPSGDRVEGEIVIGDDGSYRVALTDADGLSNPGETEYFIRTLEDRPPDVRVVKPAGDRQVTPIEEVSIEARADDDFGVAAFDLVYSVRGRVEKVLPFRRDGSGVTVTGQRTLYLEDLGVQPGDFVTYYARATDVSRGKRSTEARSDIFFLEVKPFEEEFVAAQSQAMGAGGGGGDRSLDDLAAAQKEIIVATWKLDARGRHARGQSQEDIRNVARAQGEVQKRAQAAAAELSRSGSRRTQRPGGARTPGEPAANDEPMMKAVEAMGKARQELEGLKTTEALPHEMTALNELLRAQAEVRRRQVQRQQNAMGGGGGSNRQQQDLSTLFDRELTRHQATNYETPNSVETREEKTDKDDALQKIRELARRQDALNREQQELAKQREQMTAEELKRQLERLTREQSELRRQAEELARQMQQGQQKQQNQQGPQSQSQTQAKGQQSRGQGSQQSQSRGQGQSSSGNQSEQQQQQDAENSRALRQASEEMQNATSDLRRQDPRQASQRGSRALDKLRELEQRMRSAQPDDRRRALGELQLESRQLADAQRQLASEAHRQGQNEATGRHSETTSKPGDARGRQSGKEKQNGAKEGQNGAAGEESQSSADARRRRAAEQDRLADRADRLEESIKQLARGAQGIEEEERKALTEAAREVERQRLAERMRKISRAARDGSGAEGERKDADAQSKGVPKGTHIDERAAAREGEEIAKQLDRLAERLGTANGQNAETRRLSEQLSRMRELRDKLGDVDRQLSELRRNGGKRQENQDGRESQRGGDSQSGQQSQGQRASSGQKGGDGSRDGELARPEAQGADRAWQQSRELVDELQREHGIGGTPEMTRLNPGISAPGTEAWKQDFAKWEELKVQLAAALENAETSLASQLREQESKDRLNAGATQAVPERYRRLVDQYYRALASKKDRK